MSDRIFNLTGWEAKAIVEGRKTVLRRPASKCGPVQPGDTLIGREACRIWHIPMTVGNAEVEYRCDEATVRHKGCGHIGGGGAVDYGHDLLDYAQEHSRWRPAVQMPRRSARIVRPVVSARVERLHDITEDDAVDGEGFDGGGGAFAEAWDARYAKRGLGWGGNPWVWRVEVGPDSPPRVRR